MLRHLLTFAGFTAVALLAGCMTPAVNDAARVGPFYQPTNVAHDPTLGGIRRVLLMPVWGSRDVLPVDSGVDLDGVFLRALQEENRFEIVTMARADCQQRFGAAAFSSSSALPHDFFDTVSHVYAADAVMFIDITSYRAYHPLVVGIRAKLATVNAARLVWTFDNVYAADNPLVANAARRFFLEGEHQDVPGDLTPAVLQSPGRFAAYAARSTFDTLPPVTLGQLTESSSRSR